MTLSKKLTLLTSIVCSIFIGLIFFGYKTINAQYGSESYGGVPGSSSNSSSSCAYGATCPADQPTPTPTPNPTPTPITTADPTPEQVNNTDTPAPQEEAPKSPSPIVRKKASEQVEAKGLQGIILKQAVDVVEKIPESQRVVAPYYSWLALLVLSAALLIVAAFDRYKSVKLVNSIKKLRDVLQEQSNFLRLALHNLNTPLATTKGALELLESANPNEPEAVQKLKPAALELESTIVATTAEVTNQVETTNQNPNIVREKGSFFSNIGQWYFFVPVIVAVLFGLLINSALSYTNTGKPANYGLIQIAVAVMVCLIFANAIRVLRISRRQKSVYHEAQNLINQLNGKRSQIILTLSESLGKVTTDVREACQLISDKKLATILNSSVSSLESLAYKVRAATTPLSSAPQQSSLTFLINDILTSKKQAFDAKLIHVSTSYNTPDNLVFYVPELKLIISSVIENSIEYGKENGNIAIKSSLDNKTLQVIIEDDGIGIDKDSLDKLFKPFSKADDVLTYDHQGMGMSLYVISTVAKRLGGNIKISSEKNIGTVTSITIPLP